MPERKQRAPLYRFTVTMDEGLYERLTNAAAIDRRSLNSAIQAAVDKWCDRIEREQRGEG